MPSTKIHGTIDAVPKEMAAATGQPTSTIGRSRPVFSTMALVAVPRVVAIRPMTRLIAMKPTPMVSDARTARPIFIRNTMHRMKMMSGRTMLGPRLSTY